MMRKTIWLNLLIAWLKYRLSDVFKRLEIWLEIVGLFLELKNEFVIAKWLILLSAYSYDLIPIFYTKSKLPILYVYYEIKWINAKIVNAMFYV